VYAARKKANSAVPVYLPTKQRAAAFPIVFKLLLLAPLNLSRDILTLRPAVRNCA